MTRLGLFLVLIAVTALPLTAQPKPSGTTYPSRRMADGKQWTTQNLNVNTPQSYCYEEAELNCRQYGRLYTWEAARRGCQSLGDGWRLPTDDEWRQMAQHYGGLLEDSADGAKATEADGSVRSLYQGVTDQPEESRAARTNPFRTG